MAPRPGQRPGLGAVTAASALGIAVPGYIHHGLAALGPFLIVGFSMSKTDYGLLMASFSAMGAVASPMLGALADRVGGRRMLTWSFVAAIAVAAGISLAPVLWVVFGGALVGGLTAAAANPATNTLVGTDVPPERRGLVVGIKQAGGPAGIAAAGAVLPWLATSVGWRAAYATGAVLPLVGLGLLAVARPSGAGNETPGPTNPPPPWRTAFGPEIRTLTANGAAVGLGTGAVLGFVAVYGVEALGMSETAAGAQLTVIGVLGFLARLGWGAVADRRLDSTALLAALSALSTVGAGLAWLAADTGAWLLVVSSVVLGCSAMSWNAVGMLAVLREMPSERAGTASGIVVLGFLTGFGLGPWLFGVLVDATGGYAAGWAMVTASFAVSAAFLWRPRRRAVAAV